MKALAKWHWCNTAFVAHTRLLCNQPDYLELLQFGPHCWKNWQLKRIFLQAGCLCYRPNNNVRALEGAPVPMPERKMPNSWSTNWPQHLCWLLKSAVKNSNFMWLLRCVCFCRFNPQKGFYCQIRHPKNVSNSSGSTLKCLGRGKGRSYPPMDAKSEALLKSFYRKPNVALSKLLLKLGQDVPNWLQEQLSDVQ